MTQHFDGPACTHYQEIDPGVSWTQDPWIAIDSPSTDGRCNMLTPNVVKLPGAGGSSGATSGATSGGGGGGYRMYYTQLDRVQDYERSTGNIRSAVSQDAQHWEIEPGVRLDVFAPHAAQRVLCPDVAPLPDGTWRMYAEAKAQHSPTAIVSARSEDGLTWEPEPGPRFASDDESYGAPRCLYLHAGFRLYCQRYSFPFRPGLDAHNEIISAISDDGLTFRREEGVRIRQQGEAESYANNGPEVVRLGDGTYRMYYAGWQADPVRARIFTATSADGLKWVRHPAPCIDVGRHGSLDIIKASEACVIDLPDGRHRLFYEACDAAGQWRILSATSAGTPRDGHPWAFG